MKNLFYLIAAAGFIMISCAKTDDKPQPNEEHKYSFSIGAERETDEDSAPETRIEIVDGAHHWSVGDKVGMFIIAQSMQNRINNLAMMGQHTKPTKSTSFIGELTESQMAMISPSNLTSHQYVTYFPYNPSNTLSGIFLYLHFNISQTMTIRKNEFPSDYTFMYATALNSPPITWLDGNGKQQYGERIAFNYKHALSYLRVRLDINLMSLPVTKIEIVSDGVAISGNARVNTNTEVVDIEDGNSADRTINISEGIDIGDELYIPLPPTTYSANTLTFRFTFSNGVTYERVIPNELTLQSGKVHNIAFKLPFIADLEKYSGLTPVTIIKDDYKPIDYLGHTFWGYGVCRINETFIGLGNPQMGFYGVLETPVLNLGNKTSIPVEVRTKIYANLSNGLDGNNYKINSVNGSYGTDYTQSELIYNVPLTTRVTKEYSTIGIVLTSSAPKIAIFSSTPNIYSLEIYPL